MRNILHKPKRYRTYISHRIWKWSRCVNGATCIEIWQIYRKKLKRKQFAPVINWRKVNFQYMTRCTPAGTRRTTPLLRRNDVATSFWGNNGVIIASFAHWVRWTVTHLECTYRGFLINVVWCYEIYVSFSHNIATIKQHLFLYVSLWRPAW